jgi:hypothetical protein
MVDNNGGTDFGGQVNGAADAFWLVVGPAGNIGQKGAVNGQDWELVAFH